jgi:hypothetical protein
VSNQWTDTGIERVIQEQWLAHKQTYEYQWIRQLLRRVAHDLHGEIERLEKELAETRIHLSSTEAAQDDFEKLMFGESDD